MNWQGCRHVRNRRFAPLGVRTGLLTILIMLTAIALHAAEVDPPSQAALPVDYRVELHWKSDSPRRWGGKLAWAEREASAQADTDHAGIAAVMSDPVNLTSGPILSAGVLETSGGGLLFGPPQRFTMLPEGEGKLASVLTTGGGISFRVRGDAMDRLVLRLDGDAETAAWISEFSLAELTAGHSIEKVVDDCASVSIGRQASDALRVRLGAGATVLSTGELVEVTAEGDAPGQFEAPDLELILECLTYSASDYTLVRSEFWPARIVDGRLTVDRPQWTAPEVEGAYRVRWQLRTKTPPRGSAAGSLTPLALATSWTQSISEAMPAALSAPFHLPRSLSLPLSGSSEHAAIFHTEFSIAVIAPQLPQPQPPSPMAPDRLRWRMIDKAEPREAALAVSRLLPRQTNDWLAAASARPRSQRSPLHDGKRLTVLDPGVQLEYAVPLSGLGRPHRASIRMPAEKAMQITVELLDGPEGADATGATRTRPLGPGLVITRNGFTVDAHPWHTATIDFWPRSLNTRLVLTNSSADEVASFESIEIHVADLDPAEPAVRSSDPPATRLAAMRLELNDLFEQFSDSGVPTLQNPLDYQSVWVAGNRLIETLVREGYGGVILTVSSDGSTCYPSEMAFADASWNANGSTAGGPVDALELLMRMFDRASLTLVPCIRPSLPLLALEQEILRDPAANASIAAPSPLGGQLGKWSFDGPPMTAFGIYNPTHPAVAEQVGALFGELSRRCKPHPCVSMIGILADQRTYIHLSPIAITDPQTLDAFHASLGEAAPPRANMVTWINSSGAATFEQWRAEQAHSLFGRILDGLNQHRLLVMSLDSALSSNMVELGRDPRILTARLHRRSLIEPLGLRVRDEACNASVPISLGSAKSFWSHDFGLFHQPVTELRRGGPLQPSASPWHRGETLVGGAGPRLTPLLDPEESSLAFAQLLNRSDRKVVAIGGGGMNQPGSDVRRRSIHCFSQLPPIAMTDVTSENAIGAVRVRLGRYQGDTYIYAINQARWPVAVDVTLSRAVAIKQLGPGQSGGTRRIAGAKPMTFEGDPPASRRQTAAATRWNPTLAAGELAAIRVTGEETEILNWESAFVGEDQQLAMIRGYVQDVVAALAQLGDAGDWQTIENAGFEQDAIDTIPGWLTAQYPPGCVAIDRAVAFQGKQSLRLIGQAGQAGGSWIVSQVISPPSSCRLAVTVRLRGEPSEAARSLPPLVVRMALEGTVGGTPMRKTKSITVPRDGNWTEPAERLEIALLPSVPVESLRLTIDLMSAGVVWIDEVSFFDKFMTRGEKTQLDHLVFLAAGGASRGDWTGASRLLDSHWALNLADSRSSEKTRNRSAAALATSAEDGGAAKGVSRWGPRAPASVHSGGGNSSPDEQLRPSVTERLKSWLPRQVRF